MPFTADDLWSIIYTHSCTSWCPLTPDAWAELRAQRPSLPAWSEAVQLAKQAGFAEFLTSSGGDADGPSW